MRIKTITDEEILDLILAGRLRIKDRRRRDPIIIKDGRELSASIIPGRRNPRYRVSICLPRKPYSRKRRRRCRTIIRSKLVWMIDNRSLVPIGCVVHHDNEDRFNDRPSNLIAKTFDDHNGIHYEDTF